MTSLNGQTRLGFEHQPGLKKLPPFRSPKHNNNPLSFHIYSDVLIEQVKQSHGQSLFFQKTTTPPAPGHLGGSKLPCFSPTVFDAGRLAFHHHAASAGRSGRTSSGETTEDGSKVRAFGEIVVYRC